MIQDDLSRWIVVVAFAVMIGCQHQGSPPAAAPQAPSTSVLTFVSVQGEPYAWPRTNARKATVLIFTSSTCPIANGYAPEIKRLCSEYEPKGIKICLVHTEQELTLKDAQVHAEDYGHTCPIVLDPQRKLVHLAGAKVTPEAAVFDATGKLVYRGRIDDRFPEIGVNRDQPRTTELRDALDAILAGRPVHIARTTAVGCYIEGSALP